MDGEKRSITLLGWPVAFYEKAGLFSSTFSYVVPFLHFDPPADIVSCSFRFTVEFSIYFIGFNHGHGRSGQLFQNRYKSIICKEDIYLRELVRYIHLTLYFSIFKS